MQRVLESARQAREDPTLFERDGYLFEKRIYSWELVSVLRYIASRIGRINVLDVGGSLGSIYYQNVKFLEDVVNRWEILEQPNLASIGNSEFTTPPLSFGDDLASAIARDPDVVLFSGSFQYLELPFEYLRAVDESNCSYLIFDRLFVSTDQSAPTEICKQFVQYSDFSTSYPTRVFSELELKELMDLNWRLFEEWDGWEIPLKEDMKYWGSFWIRK